MDESRRAFVFDIVNMGLADSGRGWQRRRADDLRKSSYDPSVFIGTPLYTRELGGIVCSSWIAAPTFDAEHIHVAAHFMFIAAGTFLTGPRLSRAHSPLIFNPPNTTHRDRFDSPAGRFFSISFAVAPDDAPYTTREIDSVPSHAIVSRLMRECERWDCDSSDIVDTLCTDLIATLNEHGGRRAKPRWLSRAAEILNTSSRVSLAQLSREIGVHRTHLTRTFRQFHGCTPAEFARIARLRRAASALASTKRPLVDVALAAGFADQSHFTKHFRAAFGVPPGEYRRLSR